MTLINSHIVYKSLTKSSISQKHFIQKVCKELTQNTPLGSNETPVKCSSSQPRSQSRITCKTSKCKNRTTDRCGNAVFGTCSRRVCKNYNYVE